MMFRPCRPLNESLMIMDTKNGREVRVQPNQIIVSLVGVDLQAQKQLKRRNPGGRRLNREVGR